MPKLDVLEIILDNANAVVGAGQALQGKVHLALNEGMKMRNVRMKVVGRAYNHWTESHTTGSGNNRHTTTEHYSAEEVYLDYHVVLWGRPLDQEGDNPVMPPGNYTFPFQVGVPLHCPTSFEGGYGHIRYQAKVTIDRPWKFDHSCKVPFTVIGLRDLNQNPAAAQPLYAHDEKQLGCWCCVAGNIYGTISLPKSGYVPGERLPFQVEVHNASSRIIEEVNLDLKQIVVFTASHGYKTHTRSTSETIVKVENPTEIAQDQTWNWPDTGIRLPPVPPSDIGSRIIDIRYQLHLEINPSGPSLDLDIYGLMIVGNIPLMVRPTAPPPGAVPGIGPSGPPGEFPLQPLEPTAGAVGDNVLPPSYEDLAPPSYEESVFGKANIRDDDDNDHTKGAMEYAPRYPVYGFK